MNFYFKAKKKEYFCTWAAFMFMYESWPESMCGS